MTIPNARLGTETTCATPAAPHQVLVCTTCRHQDSPCTPGLKLIAQLQNAIQMLGMDDAFEVSGTVCMAGCARPCTVAWRASGKATYLFGDIEPDADIDDLVAFAQLYQRLEDGWCNAADRPGKLADTALARIPAALGVTGPRGAVQ